MDRSSPHSRSPTNFRQWFFRGLAILLPSVLTIWILITAWQFVHHRIAEPINFGIREIIVAVTPWPTVERPEINEQGQVLLPQELQDHRDEVQADPQRRQRLANAQNPELWLWRDARRARLNELWATHWYVLDLIGLIVAIVLIYMAGLLLGSYIGRKLYARGESLVNQLPLIGRVYPAIKQVTDFVVGQDQPLQFNHVVAVQYPRKGLWSVGLVTGDTLNTIQQQVGVDCMTVFIPSSPTPFTGYVITVPRDEAIDLPISVEDAIKFAVSAGVLVPEHEKIKRDPNAPTLEPATTPASLPPPTDSDTNH